MARRPFRRGAHSTPTPRGRPQRAPERTPTQVPAQVPVPASAPAALPPLGPDSLGRATTGSRLLHEAELLGFAGGAVSREQCWSQLSASVADRVVELAGPTLAWSASSPAPGAIQAVVVGRRALVVADPVQRPGPAGPVAAHRVSSYRFDESTLLHAQVAHTPAQVFTVASPRTAPPGVTPGARPGSGACSGACSGAGSAAEAVRRLPARLDEDTGRVLRSMPEQARDLITLPITATGEEILRCHSFWQGFSENALNVVMVVLASAHCVTFACGARCIPDGADPSAAHWALDCWHADVIQRSGQ